MTARLGLFEAVGIELEYMIVDAESLDVLPMADRLLEAEAGALVCDVERGLMGWSNELALHLIELKTNGPVETVAGLAGEFQREVAYINGRLVPWQAHLLPTGTHPWMDPRSEFRIWPHEFHEVYATFDRLFDCARHGWANLQSVHVNLPFSTDAEFARLHSAIRLVLPIVPALAASTPIAEGAVSGSLDTRLAVYRSNAARIPSITGAVIPEPVESEAEYVERILEPIYRDLEPLDPEGILRDEWVNARGAIARFDRGTIEIRVIDMQECPAADVAIAALVSAVVEALATEAHSRWTAQRDYPGAALAALLEATIHHADEAPLPDRDYLALVGCADASGRTMGDLWQLLLERHCADGMIPAELHRPLDVIGRSGCLARRMLASVGEAPSRDKLRSLYRELAACLAEGRQLGANG